MLKAQSGAWASVLPQSRQERRDGDGEAVASATSIAPGVTRRSTVIASRRRSMSPAKVPRPSAKGK